MLTRAALAEDLRAEIFGHAGAGAARRLGAEVEFIPLEAGTGRRCPIEAQGVISTLPFLRRFGARHHWREAVTAKGTPCFLLPAGGTVTFEPGGQLEYSAPPCSTASTLLARLHLVVPPLTAAAADEGIELVAAGIDPVNSIECSPLLLRPKRYERMAEYLASRGPAGARMMRQTASVQLNLDFGDEPWLRWKVANALVPYLTAIFANSPVYAGEPTGSQSERAAVWRAVDPARTGIVYDERRPLEAYLEFALSAPAMLYRPESGEWKPFAHQLVGGNPGLDDWREHLSTLFPEVRPRGHLELRSPDSVPARWYPATIALVAGVLYQPDSLHSANELLGTPDPGLLEPAGVQGLHAPQLARTAVDLVELAITGCRTLGPAYFHPSDLEQAEDFFEQYTRRGRAPADDAPERAIAA